MRERLGDRLPNFSQQDRELLKHSVDFIGLNHYTSRFVGHAANSLEENDFYKIQDVEIIGMQDLNNFCHLLDFSSP